jgi:hypothetical protein
VTNSQRALRSRQCRQRFRLALVEHATVKVRTTQYVKDMPSMKKPIFATAVTPAAE